MRKTNKTIFLSFKHKQWNPFVFAVFYCFSLCCISLISLLYNANAMLSQQLVSLSKIQILSFWVNTPCCNSLHVHNCMGTLKAFNFSIISASNGKKGEMSVTRRGNRQLQKLMRRPWSIQLIYYICLQGETRLKALGS